ncbi:MAG: peptidoglycan DD-metalloendopeptidase family protein [Bacteroidia bacterium]|nr:peptidoglycan DD-metalloendopeptidase family protein [Bacteroidia bacterium]
MKVYLYIYIFIYMLLGVAQGQTKKELENKKKKLQSDIRLTKDLLEETKQNKKQSLTQLVTLNKKIGMHEELITTISSQVSLLDREITENNTSAQQLTTELKSLKDEYALMIKYAYKNKGTYDRFMFLMSSASFNQAYNRLKYLQQYSVYRQTQGKLIVTKQQELVAKINQLSIAKGEKVTLVVEQKNEVGELTGEKQNQEKSLVQLQQKEKELKTELKKKQEDAQRLQAAIQAIIEEEIRKAREQAIKEQARKAVELAAAKEKERIALELKKKKEGKKDIKKDPVKPIEKDIKPIEHKANVLILTPEAQTLSSSFEANKGRLPWPVTEGVIISRFGIHDHPVLKSIKVKNDGINISTKRGAAVRVVFDGEVTGVVSIPNAGKAVIVRHGDYLSVYTNLNDVMVKKGDKLKIKQNIGTINIDEDNKSEFQLQIWKGSNTLDPQNWIYSN